MTSRTTADPAAPWPAAPGLPRPHLMDQRWEDAVFLHWRIPVPAAAARMPPGVRADVVGIGEAARLRGLSLRGGSRRDALRRFARLTVPLLATSLERGLDQGEALDARGFGLARPTRLPERPLSRRERLAAIAGVELAVALAAARSLGWLGYRYYPTLEPLTGGAAALAAGALAVSLATSSLLGRRS